MNIPHQVIIVISVLIVLLVAIIIVRKHDSKSNKDENIINSEVFKPSEYSEEYKKASEDSGAKEKHNK